MRATAALASERSRPTPSRCGASEITEEHTGIIAEQLRSLGERYLITAGRTLAGPHPLRQLGWQVGVTAVRAAQ